MDVRGEIYWSANGNPRRKIYLDESSGVPVQDIWLEFRDAHNQNIEITGYPTEKNPQLLRRIIQASSNPGDLVLDCFFGSGTTLAMASQLNRQWIGVDNGVEAITTTLRRFAIGSEPMGDFVKDRKSTHAESEALPLFQYGNLSQPAESSALPVNGRNHTAIRDFSLYALEPYQNGLEETIQQWL